MLSSAAIILLTGLGILMVLASFTILMSGLRWKADKEQELEPDEYYKTQRFDS